MNGISLTATGLLVFEVEQFLSRIPTDLVELSHSNIRSLCEGEEGVDWVYHSQGGAFNRAIRSPILPCLAKDTEGKLLIEPVWTLGDYIRYKFSIRRDGEAGVILVERQGFGLEAGEGYFFYTNLITIAAKSNGFAFVIQTKGKPTQSWQSHIDWDPERATAIDVPDENLQALAALLKKY